MPLLQVAEAEVRFGGVHALRGVDLSVDGGSVTGLIGPNGAGKTTLFNAVCGLQGIQAGRITFDGTRSHPTPARPTSPGGHRHLEHRQREHGQRHPGRRRLPAGSNGADPTLTAPSGSGNPLAASSAIIGVGALSATSWSLAPSSSANAQASATLGLSLTTTKLIVFTLSAAMAGVAGALFGGAESVVGGTDFQMFESLLIRAVVAIGGAADCSGALAGGLALGFLPGNAQDVFIGAGTVALAFYPDGVLPLFYVRLQR
ncbi:MAG: ATP-binding cassette domain-containing protein [Acidimicrobiales bacterium]|jgi:energy-coupling factor transporter ATP-binding protein EcfA2